MEKPLPTNLVEEIISTMFESIKKLNEFDTKTIQTLQTLINTDDFDNKEELMKALESVRGKK